MTGVRVDAWKRLLTQVRSMEARAVDLAPVLTAQAALLRGVIVRSFGRSQSPNGKPWAPLADSTIASRRKQSSKPLLDRGLLRRSVVTRGEERSIVFGVTGARATIAPFHQFGTRRMPRRAFLPMDRQGRGDFSGGDAERWRDRAGAAILAFILRGQL